MIQSPNAWTFAGLALDEDGACFAAERKGLRDIKPKALLVHYPNPFAGGGEPELIHKSSDPFNGIWRGSGGALHILGNKKYHFQVNGKFKTKSVVEPAQRMTQLAGFGGRILMALGWPEGYLEFAAGESQALEIGLPGRCTDIAGTGTDDIYVSTGCGMAHFDGDTWRVLEGAPEDGHLLCVSRDEVYCTGRDAKLGKVFSLYRGNARDGFEGIIKQDELQGATRLDNLVRALGEVFILQTHDVDRGLYRLQDGNVTKVMAATGSTGRVAGNAEVLWVENGIELLCTNGSEWVQIPRIDHDKSKA